MTWYRSVYLMVEMMEATMPARGGNASTILMSWDGERRLAMRPLAQSIIEYIHDRTGAKTLFATHYHAS